MKNDEREEWLKLTDQMQMVLSTALNSLGGKNGEGHQWYIFHSAAHIHRAVAGYVVLLRQGLHQSAVLLVRTALEAMFRMKAVEKDPSVVCRIAASEREEEVKMLENFEGDTAKEALEIIKAQRCEFEQKYRAKYPEYPFIDEKISLFKLAESVGLKNAYNTHYRIYCKFTHAALRAMMGGFDEAIDGSAPVMAACAVSAIESLIPIGANVEGFPELQRLFSEMNARLEGQDPTK